MKPLLVIYATREGHTRRIAEHVGSTLEAQGRPLELVDAAHLPSDFDLGNYGGAIVAASLHAGKHQAEIVRLVKHHLGELQQLPTLFLSVSLTEVTVEDPAADPEKRAQAAADVKRTIDEFLTDTGWHPSHVAGVAGALPYTKYNFVIRYVMKRIARKVGGPVDTSRDYEFTDWHRLDDLVMHFVQSVPA
jgi:menaquinone-dependent protoporphyrinogen oxidase